MSEAKLKYTPEPIFELKVDHDIPIPGRHYRAPGTISSTFKTMQVGDSFVVPRAHRAGLAARARAVNIKVTGRMINDEEIRVWRIA